MNEPRPQSEDDQAAAADPPTTMGKAIDLPNGCRVAGYILETGGFQWIFTNERRVQTRVSLSQDATYAIALIAEALLNPGKSEDA